MDQSVRGIVSIVAGLGQPLEVEIIRGLLKTGAMVIMPASNANLILRIKNEVADIGTGTLITLITDPMDYERSKELLDHIVFAYGRIDLVIVVTSQVYAPEPLMELDYTSWDYMQGAALSFCFMAARLILPLMKREHRGTFIQISNDPEDVVQHASPLDRIATTVQMEVSRIFDEEVSKHGVRYYHVFSNTALNCIDRQSEAAGIIDLFQEETKAPGLFRRFCFALRKSLACKYTSQIPS